MSKTDWMTFGLDYNCHLRRDVRNAIKEHLPRYMTSEQFIKDEIDELYRDVRRMENDITTVVNLCINIEAMRDNKSQTTICPCGGRYTKIHRLGHYRSKKHKAYQSVNIF